MPSSPVSPQTPPDPPDWSEDEALDRAEDRYIEWLGGRDD